MSQPTHRHDAAHSGLVPTAQLGTGTPDGTKFLRDDQTFAVPPGTGKGLPLGLTGATAATRYVGATASGAPVSGTFATGDFIIDQSGTAWVCTAAGSPGTWVQIVAGTVTHAIMGPGLFGTGNDGPLSLTQSSAAPAWAAKTGSGATTTFTLNRDIYATTLHLDNSAGGFIIATSGFRIFANSTMTIDSSCVISNDGAAAPAAPSAAGNRLAGTIDTAVGSGGAGGTNSTGSGGNNVAHSAATRSVTNVASGGAGGIATGGGTGGGGPGGIMTCTAVDGTPDNLFIAITLNGSYAGAQAKLTGAAGGGGGGATGGTTAKGGGGGAGGGIVGIYAQTLVNNGTIRALGGLGQTGSIGNGSGAGGGGGGGGGVVVLVYGMTGSTTGSVSVAGGNGGGAVGTGATGVNGSSGLTYLLAF